MQVDELAKFEKSMNDELFGWLVRNEHLRRSTGQHFRLFTYRHPDKIEINLNCLRSDYLEKFVKGDHEAYFGELLKRIEPVIFKVMATYVVTEISVKIEFYLLARTYSKNVSYNFSTRTT
jgi:hypothetical protein